MRHLPRENANGGGSTYGVASPQNEATRRGEPKDETGRAANGRCVATATNSEGTQFTSANKRDSISSRRLPKSPTTRALFSTIRRTRAKSPADNYVYLIVRQKVDDPCDTRIHTCVGRMEAKPSNSAVELAASSLRWRHVYRNSPHGRFAWNSLPIYITYQFRHL